MSLERVCGACRCGGCRGVRAAAGGSSHDASLPSLPSHWRERSGRGCGRRGEGAHLGSLRSREKVGAAGDRLLAGAAVPDAHGHPLHGVLAAEDACVLRVLADLHLLDLITERGTIAHAILASDASLLGALRARGATMRRRGEHEHEAYSSTTRYGARPTSKQLKAGTRTLLTIFSARRESKGNCEGEEWSGQVVRACGRHSGAGERI